MKIFEKLRYYFNAIRNNWKIKYLLVIKNKNTHQEKISILLSPKNIFVLVTTGVLMLIFLTIILIAFTPLRVYVPGYTNPDDYQNYKKNALRVDSLDMVLKRNQQYVDNFYNVLHDRILEEEESAAVLNEKYEGKKELSEKEQKKRQQAKETVFEEAEMIMNKASEQRTAGGMSIPISERADISRLFLLSPAHGVIISEFNPVAGKMGINIRNVRNTLVSSVADGIIIYAGYDPIEGNTIIIQHHNNVLSVYKHVETILKNVGYKVKGGEPVAKMGDSGTSPQEVNLYFELWYNGIQVNPSDYIVIN